MVFSNMDWFGRY